MTTLISIQGENARMGRLFKTPKFNLLYKGVPAIQLSIENMKEFGKVRVLGRWDQTLACPNLELMDYLPLLDCFKKARFKDSTFFVDCDVIPFKLNKPQGDTVYLFKNENGVNQYSNFKVENGLITDCNEKGETFNYCGAGVYYLTISDYLYTHSIGATSLSQVFANMVKAGMKVYADTTSNIFRFGTLKDII